MSSSDTLIRISRGAGENPCRYCTSETGRTQDCHGKCERYLAFFKREQDMRKVREAAAAEDADYVQYTK